MKDSRGIGIPYLKYLTKAFNPPFHEQPGHLMMEKSMPLKSAREDRVGNGLYW